MRTTVLTVMGMLCASLVSAQTDDLQSIRSTRSGYGGNGVFTIGPRLSNYSTDVREIVTPLKTGRQNSFGLVGDYRNGNFVLDFLYDHDPANGIGIVDLIVDTGNYSHDHGEATVGFAATPFLDLQGGLRTDSTRVGGVVVVGFPVSTDLNIDHQALTGGLKLHTDGIPLGFFVTARGFVGTAKVDVGRGKVDTDTSGYRGEAGLNIHIGESAWSVQPGYEFDHFETKNRGLRIHTNRLFLNFVFRRGR
ncbi:MAG: hypothetical protein NVSMB68_11480 [Thermoanaerobaculia bacterium]